MKTKYGLLAFVTMLALAAVSSRAADVEEESTKYFETVTTGKDDAAAKKIGDGIFTALNNDKNDEGLNNFSWKIMTDAGIEHRDLDLALRAAKAAYDACEGKKAHIVDTYAHALFDTGKIADAVEFQKKAVELSEDDNEKSELTETLKKYQAKAGEKK